MKKLIKPFDIVEDNREIKTKNNNMSKNENQKSSELTETEKSFVSQLTTTVSLLIEKKESTYYIGQTISSYMADFKKLILK